jgi:hypothetical protein
LPFKKKKVAVNVVICGGDWFSLMPFSAIKIWDWLLYSDVVVLCCGKRDRREE